MNNYINYRKYIRQTAIEEVGKKGQDTLLNSKILVVGAGGLGSAVIEYLAAAGVGTIGIVDGDHVKLHNLQRQTIHAGKMGMNKAKSAMLFIKKLNPDVKVDTYPFNLNANNASKIIEKYDVVVSCPDNIETRFIINENCVKLEKPMVHGAVYKFEGEVSSFIKTPCYQCLYSGIKNKDIEDKAIIGFTAGVIGCLQAAEAIKILLGLPTLKGELLRVDLKNMEFIKIKIKSNPSCKVCAVEI